MHAATDGRSGAAPSSGVVAIAGPAGQVQRLRVSCADSAESIEHCLRGVFGIPVSTRLLLRDREGLALPLGAGLLSVPGADGKSQGGPVFSLAVVREQQQSDLADCKTVVKAWQMNGDADGETPKSQPRLPPHLPVSRGLDEMSDTIEVEDSRIPLPQSGRGVDVCGGSSKSSGSRLANTTSSVSLGMAWEGSSINEEKPEDIIEAHLLEIKALDCTPISHEKSGQAWTEVMPVPPEMDDLQRMPSSISFTSQATSGKLQKEDKLWEELRFWCEAASGFKRANGAWMKRVSISRRRSVGAPRRNTGEMDAADLAMYDSSDQRIDNLFNLWASNSGKLYPEAVRFRLQDEFGLALNSTTFAEALERIGKSTGGNSPPAQELSDTFRGDEEMGRDTFKMLWQRLMLGAVCQRKISGDFPDDHAEDYTLIEYSEQDMDMVCMTEEQLLFKSPLRIPGRSRVTRKRGYARWVRSSSESADRMLRLGVKFFLHPIAVSDAIMAARVGMTKIDRYNHQYFVSLEVYALKHDYSSEIHDADASASHAGGEPLRVGSSVIRSVMFLVATGNPNDKHRNWLLSVINNRTEGTDDPLDFFKSDSAAANQVLDSVYIDLEANGRIREYQADFLLYTIIDRAAKEMTPICIAYGHRLRWLQDQLHTQKLSLPAQYVDEASSVRLEMQELRQWLGQLKGILKTLSADCSAINHRGDVMPWNFGAHAEGRGKSLLLFLSSTEAHLEQSSDRLATLDELARSFLEHHQRHRDAFINNILLTLTVATAVFMPAQLLAGIYGTNFVDEDGNPSIPELRWKYGYAYFLLSSFSVIAVGLFLAFICLRRRG